MAVEIRPCACVSPYQDKNYGKGQRVYNVCGGKNKGKLRCTVCARQIG